MKIGVISDSHDRLDGIDNAIEIFRNNNVDMVVHCGDWVAPFTFDYFAQKVTALKIPVKGVFGNNDAELARIATMDAALDGRITLSLKSVLEFEAGGKQIAVYHGQDVAVLGALIKCKQYDAVFCGHTHTIRNEKVGATLVLNPGAACFIQNQRMIDTGSVAIYDTETNSARTVTFDRPR